MPSAAEHDGEHHMVRQWRLKLFGLVLALDNLCRFAWHSLREHYNEARCVLNPE